MQFFARLRSRKKKGGSRLFRYGWKVTLLILLAGAGFAVFLFYGTWASTFDMKNVGEMPERNTVYDVDGRIYSRLAGANRLKVSLSEVSPFFITAVLAREDSRFYDHKGIDWRGIMRALVRDITSGSAKEGASSITQQLARNSLPLGGRTLSRKLLEAMVALRIERQFTKQQILELYVNRIDSKSESFFAVKKSGRRQDPTERSFGSNGGIEKTFACGCRTRQTGEGCPAPQAYAFCSGELRDGRGAARFE